MTATASTKPTDRNPEIVVSETTALSPALTHTRKSLGDLERGISHYPEPIRTETIWLQGFYLDHCKTNFVTLRAISCKCKHEKSKEYFYNIVTGQNFRGGAGDWKVGGKAWSEFLQIVSDLRRYDQSAARTGKLPFVQTPTYHCIADFIDAHRALDAVCKFGGITGPTGGQKSECFKFYRTLNNHGAVIHVEAPADGKLSKLQAKIAGKYNVSGHKIERRREAVIRENVNETRTIIIDNAQRLYVPSRGADQPAFNWLLEIQDDTSCTIILSFTTDFVDVLVAGAAKGFFEQFIGRMGGDQNLINLPDYAPESDLLAIAHSFDLEPGKKAMEWLVKWSRQQGRIRIVFDKLQRAREFCQLDGRTRITLADMAEADAYIPPAIGTFNPEEDAA